MRKFLLKYPDNAKWLAAQGKSRAETGAAAQIRLEAFPELSLESRSRVSLEAARDRISKRTNYEFCRSIAVDVVDSVFPSDPVSHEASVPSSIRLTNSKRQSLTQKQRYVAIFFHFHGSLGNYDAEVTCKVFGIHNGTFVNWITKKQYYSKWLPFVSSFKCSDVFNEFPHQFKDKFDQNVLDMTSIVSIPSKYSHQSGKSYVSGNSISSKSMQSVAKRARKSAGITYIRNDSRTVWSERKVKYVEQEEFLLSLVVRSWECGNPVSRPEIYLELMREFGISDGSFPPLSEFATKMKLHSGQINRSLSQWVKMRLDANNWSLRRESVSQMVPADWFRMAVVACEEIRSTVRDCDVLINADEVFMNFYPRETTYVVPTGNKRVGSNIASDTKKGCTVMISSKMCFSSILPPPPHCNDWKARWDIDQEIYILA